jgi:hypothetical protein
MSAMANILLKDDAATPVETTFSPVTDTPQPLWRGQTAGVPFDGQPTIQVMANERQKSGDYRRVLKVNVPVLETLGTAGTSAGYQAAPKVAYNETFIVTQYSSSRSTTADRANALKMLAGLLAGASATTGTGTLDGASAGDAWKGSTAMAPRLFIFGDSAF